VSTLNARQTKEQPGVAEASAEQQIVGRHYLRALSGQAIPTATPATATLAISSQRQVLSLCAIIFLTTRCILKQRPRCCCCHWAVAGCSQQWLAVDFKLILLLVASVFSVVARVGSRLMLTDVRMLLVALGCG